MGYVVLLIVLLALVALVGWPLRRRDQTAAAETRKQRREQDLREQLRDLDAAREAKYQEIRDAQLDHGTGKLSDADYQAVDRTLRAEAIEILRAVDRARAELSDQPID